MASLRGGRGSLGPGYQPLGKGEGGATCAPTMCNADVENWKTTVTRPQLWPVQFTSPPVYSNLFPGTMEESEENFGIQECRGSRGWVRLEELIGCRVSGGEQGTIPGEGVRRYTTATLGGV